MHEQAIWFVACCTTAEGSAVLGGPILHPQQVAIENRSMGTAHGLCSVLTPLERDVRAVTGIL